MIDKSTYDRLMSMLSQTERAQSELITTLWKTTPPPSLADNLHNLNSEIRAAIESARKGAIEHALRVNLQNGSCVFVKAIDGDTISVDPPSGLREWMIDVRIRFYGIDTPEMNQEWGEAYRRLVSRLFEEVGGNKLFVIWERETDNTLYPGFPKESFERVVGNVFIPLTDTRVLYVNAFLGMLPHVKPIMIRGRKKVPVPVQQPLSKFECNCRLPDKCLSILDELAPSMPVDERLFPLCLCTFPQDVLAASVESPTKLWKSVLDSIGGYGCPYADMIDLMEIAGIEEKINKRSVSPFDLPLLLATKWQSRRSDNQQANPPLMAGATGKAKRKRPLN